MLLLQLRICTCVGRRQHLIQTVPHVKTNTFKIQKYFFKKQYKALLLTWESRRSECTFAICPTNVTAVYNSLIGRVYIQKSMGLCRGNPAFFIWCQGQLCLWLHLGQDFIPCFSGDSLWFCQQQHNKWLTKKNPNKKKPKQEIVSKEYFFVNSYN